MNYSNYFFGSAEIEKIQSRLQNLSRWIDEHNGANGGLWGRTAKVSEEIGEAAAAGLPPAGVSMLAVLAGKLTETVIGYTGQNPRKGQTHTGDDVDKELFDIAVTALAAVESRNGNQGLDLSYDASTLQRFAEHLAAVHTRAGLDQ